MPETPPENRPNEQIEKSKEINLAELSFEELEKLLKETKELARKTFKQVENGFVNAKGEGIYIGKVYDQYKISEASKSIPEFHRFLENNTNPILTRGSSNKEEMMQALKEMIEELEFRIIK